MRILVVGAGATGGYFGGRLVQAGRDVTFLLRERRAGQVKAAGLRLTSPHGDATLHPTIVSAEQLREEPSAYDLVLLSTKAYSLDAAMNDIAPAVGPDTLVVPILNGMRHLDVIAERFGSDRLLAGSVRIVADLTDEGIVEQRTPLGDLTVGFLPGAPARNRERLPAIGETLSAPGMRLVVPDDVIDALWQKWWLLASWNTVCILADGTIGEAIRAPYGERFTHAVLDECIAVATANGYPAHPEREAEMRAHFSNADSPITSSMFRDLHRNLPVEADHILGDLIGRAGTVPVPLLTAAYVRLKVYEAAREAGRQGASSSTVA